MSTQTQGKDDEESTLYNQKHSKVKEEAFCPIPDRASLLYVILHSTTPFASTSGNDESHQTPGHRGRGRPSKNLYVLGSGTDDLVQKENCHIGSVTIRVT